jgi:hypothetical protein
MWFGFQIPSGSPTLLPLWLTRHWQLMIEIDLVQCDFWENDSPWLTSHITRGDIICCCMTRLSWLTLEASGELFIQFQQVATGSSIHLAYIWLGWMWLGLSLTQDNKCHLHCFDSTCCAPQVWHGGDYPSSPKLVFGDWLHYNWTLLLESPWYYTLGMDHQPDLLYNVISIDTQGS